MDAAQAAARHKRRLLLIGIALLLFISFEGFAIPHLAAPKIGLSVHTLGAIEGILCLAFGLLWRKLNLSAATSALAFWLFVYSVFATLVPYVLAAIWGAGNSTIPFAAGSAHGTVLQETVIRFVLYTAAPAVLVSLVLILWGLRGAAPQSERP